MLEDFRASIIRRAPGIGGRDARLAEQAALIDSLESKLSDAKKKVLALRAELDREQAAHQELKSLLSPGVVGNNQGSPPSFRRHLLDLRRGTRMLRQLDLQRRHPLTQIPRKLLNYELAGSHGVPIPTVLAVWRDLDDLDLHDMPESFVLKSDRGAGGRGVLPLRRVTEDSFRLIGGTKKYSRDEVVQRLGHRSLGGPFFAEEVLVQPHGGDLPEDIKFYMFYGEVGHIMLRRMPQHADLKHARFRFLDGNGADLGDEVAPQHRVDATIRAPDNLTGYVEVARHLSRAVALPFVRVDVYDTTSGPVFGELTRGPGGKQEFREEHDRHLGTLWDQARFRLDLDVVGGRPLLNLHGEHPAPRLYPAGYEPLGEQSCERQRAHPVPCDLWCVQGRASERTGTTS